MNDWLSSKHVSDELKEQMKTYNEAMLDIALNKKVEFGTAGLRGTMGTGYGFINENIINWATIGYAKYLNNKFDNPSVVIAYDNRINSREFAQICANVLTNNNIKVYIFDELKSTPQLSYTIRMLDAKGGINITASHNPKVDNGYKLYNEFGGQYLPDDVTNIKNYIDEINSPINIDVYRSSNKDLLVELNDDSNYTNFIKSIVSKDFNNFEKILVSPLHGCGRIIKDMNDLIGFNNISFVNEQLDADGHFTTAPEPNPDSLIAYKFAIENVKDNKYIVATDPDADRVGLYDVLNKHLYSGNQIAALLVNYLIKTNQYKENQVIITSNVSSRLPIEIAKKHNLITKTVLTGFKWIGDIMDDDYFMGFEESNGYLIHNQTRDKDGISAAFKIFEMINYYYNNNSSIYEELESIYKEYGYYIDNQLSIAISDQSVVTNLINNIDFNTFENIDCIENYNNATRTYSDHVEPITLSKNNMLKIIFKDNSWLAIRPSGTEPKIKVYFNACSDNYDASIEKINYMKNKIEELVSI